MYTLLSSISFSLIFGQLLWSHSCDFANYSYLFLSTTRLIPIKVIFMTSFSYSKLSVVPHILPNKLSSLHSRTLSFGYCLLFSTHFLLLPFANPLWLPHPLTPRMLHPPSSIFCSISLQRLYHSLQIPSHALPTSSLKSFFDYLSSFPL